MTLISLEINDSGILAAVGSPPELITTDGGHLGSPGFALPQKKNLLVGKSAEEQAHLFPRQILHRFWDQLNTDPLENAGKYYPQNNAEIVFRHLALMWQQLQLYGDELIMAVPSHYNREHLGLMLGIAQELDIPLKGFLPLCLAASTRPSQISPERMLLYLDIDLHRVEVGYLEQGEHLVLRDSATTAEKGLLHLYRKIVDMIAREFVHNTRFDPLHTAATEQELYDRLPGLLSHLQHVPSVLFEISGGTKPYGITVQQDSLIRQAESVYNEIIRLIRRMQKKRGEGLPSLTLQISHRLNGLPGFREKLATIDDIDIIDLEHGAAAKGALQIWSGLTTQSAGRGISYFTSRPWRQNPRPGDLESVPGIVGQGTPTHLLFRSIAYPITEKPLVIGSASEHEPGDVTIALEANGVVTGHCNIIKQGNDAILENVGNQKTYVDERPISGRAVLKLGQIIRIGTPGEQLQLIQCIQDK